MSPFRETGVTGSCLSRHHGHKHKANCQRTREGGRSWFLVLDSFRSLLFPGGANVESSLFIGT